MRVLGLDPGTLQMGYGILDEYLGSVQCLEWGCLTAKARDPLHLRLNRLYQDLEAVVERWRPDHLAVEEPFVSIKRGAKSGVIVGQAQALGLLLAARYSMEVYRYSPTLVKRALTDSGSGTKTQVQLMVRLVLNLDETPYPQDASDALAVAISHIRQVQSCKRIILK